MLNPLLALPLVCLAAMASAQQTHAASSRLRAIVVHTGEIFDATWTERHLLAQAVNALHATTDEAVIRREIWLRPGEPISPAQADEVERNLRATGLFAEVETVLVPTGTDGEVDLVVTTRDKLTLAFGGGASYVGGVGTFRGRIGENNLFGTGNRVSVGFARNTDEDYRGSVAYTDLHLLDTWHTGTVRYSRTDDGDSFGIDVRRPFKHLSDPRAYGGAFRHDETENEYYDHGESVAQVFERTRGVEGDVSWGSGPADARRYLGLYAGIDERDYGEATGVLGPWLRVPGSTTNVSFGLRTDWTVVGAYREVEGIDTLGYVQDLRLGFSFGGRLGLRWREEQGADQGLQPEIAAHARLSLEPLDSLFVDLQTAGALRLHDGTNVGWNARAGTWVFAQTGEHNTIGLAATFDAAEEAQDLPIQLTLGEDNGLRGYPAREFAGSRRLRLNLENRLDTGVEYATLRLGLVAFADAGWAGEGSALGRPYEAVGLGLRLGSKPLLGDGVLRIDLARRLVEIEGDDDEWTLSVSVGQVFTFGGNASASPLR